MGGDSAVFNAYLVADPCFGKHYAVTALECGKCLCVVRDEGGLVLLRDVCMRLTQGAPLGTISRLSTRQVQHRILAGKTPHDIWQEMLNGCDPESEGARVRQILYDRFYILRGKGELLPDLPSLEDLRRSVTSASAHHHT